MASNTPHLLLSTHLSLSTIDKLNRLKRLTNSIHQVSTVCVGSTSPDIGNLLRAKQQELLQLSLDSAFREDGRFPGITNLQGHIVAFQESLNRCASQYGTRGAGQVTGFDELVYSSGIVEGHVDMLLALNSQWGSGTSTTNVSASVRCVPSITHAAQYKRPSSGGVSKDQGSATCSVSIDHKQRAHNKIITLWNDQKHTDVVFLVGEGKQRVCAHRSILACQSSYFETLLFGEMLEAREEEIVLPDVAEPEQFLSLLEYSYTGQLDISDGAIEEVLSVLALADRFGFTDLKDALSQKLASTAVTLSNVLALLGYADLYQATSLLEKCLDLIDKNAEEILSSEHFLSLPPSTVRLIISRDAFLAKEISIFNDVVQWRDQNSVSKDEFKDILSCIRLSEISSKEIFTTIEPSHLFDSASITAALRIQLKPEFQNRKPRGKKEPGKNLFEWARFASSGSVEYNSGRGWTTGPPKLFDGVVELEPPVQHSATVPTPSPGPSFQPPPPASVLLGFGGSRPNALIRSQRRTASQRQVNSTTPSSKIVDLGDIYLVNTLNLSAFSAVLSPLVVHGPVDHNQGKVVYVQRLKSTSGSVETWRFSYKIKISKDMDTWETLFDISDKDCYFEQALTFPTQAARYINFELVASEKSLQLRFLRCSWERYMKPFNFLEGGIKAPLESCPVEHFTTERLPSDCPKIDGILHAVILNTPISIKQLRFKITGTQEANAEVHISISQKWEYSAFKKVGQILDVTFGNDVSVDFDEQVLSYVIVDIRSTQSFKVESLCDLYCS